MRKLKTNFSQGLTKIKHKPAGSTAGAAAGGNGVGTPPGFVVNGNEKCFSFIQSYPKTALANFLRPIAAHRGIGGGGATILNIA